jgi:malate dehydrogenase (quinone)
MVQSPFFSSMQFATDHATIENWAPLLTLGRSPDEPLAATRVEAGTELNFGALTRQMIAHLATQPGVMLALNTTVKDIKRLKNGRWQLKLSGQKTSETISTAFVFLGAGGGALPLLQKSGIPEGRGYGGFPVSGEFMICQDPEIIAQHNAKVYGKAATGAPPMSVPHLDTRYIDGEKHLVFGPYAGFSPKFLKAGSYLDLFKSIRFDNILPTLAAGYHNLSLTVYLVKEIFRTHKGRCEMLREFFPEACNQNWRLYIAGQRVQIIKKDPKATGVLQFGTEVVASADGSLAAMLGASPGASTSPVIILDVLEKCFKDRMVSTEWVQKLAEMVPAYQVDLAKEPERYHQLAARAKALLQL